MCVPVYLCVCLPNKQNYPKVICQKLILLKKKTSISPKLMTIVNWIQQ